MVEVRTVLWIDPAKREEDPPSELEEELEESQKEGSAAIFSVNVNEMAMSLNLTPLEVEQMRVNGELIAFEFGWEKDRELMYPKWQQEDGFVLPGIKALIAEFPGQLVDLALWGERRHSQLGYEAPYMLLRHGRKDEVVEALKQDLASSMIEGF